MNDAELQRRFEDGSLPFAEWTHRAHVRIAYCYLSQHPYPVALERIRAAIQAYNAVHQVPDTPNRGYSETITVAFLRLVAAAMRTNGELTPATSEAFCDAHPQLLIKGVLQRFYSPEQLMHPRAKAEFIEPDLEQLPDVE